MSVKFEVSEEFGVSPSKLYNAWLNSEEHSGMTGGTAIVSDEVGGEFNAWDGYISGRNIELVKGEKILQTWRTTEFDTEAPDSSLCILFETTDVGARVTISHDNLPEDGMRYEQGWIDYYFEPMKAYFE
jgi:activator of HSP90 ATPase